MIIFLYFVIVIMYKTIPFQYAAQVFSLVNFIYIMKRLQFYYSNFSLFREVCRVFSKHWLIFCGRNKNILASHFLYNYPYNNYFLNRQEILFDRRLHWTECSVSKNQRNQIAQQTLPILDYIGQSVLSKLDYGTQLYSSAWFNILKSLDSAHNEAVRLYMSILVILHDFLLVEDN